MTCCSERNSSTADSAIPLPLAHLSPSPLHSSTSRPFLCNNNLPPLVPCPVTASHQSLPFTSCSGCRDATGSVTLAGRSPHLSCRRRRIPATEAGDVTWSDAGDVTGSVQRSLHFTDRLDLVQVSTACGTFKLPAARMAEITSDCGKCRLSAGRMALITSDCGICGLSPGTMALITSGCVAKNGLPLRRRRCHSGPTAR